MDLSGAGNNVISSDDLAKQSLARMARRILQEHLPAGRLSVVTKDSSLDEVMDAVKRWLYHPENVSAVRMISLT